MFKRILLFIFLAVTISSCSNTKHLAKGETLFTGSKVDIKDDEASKKERKILISDLNALVRPKPNTKTVGARVKLYLYTAAGDTKKKKGIRKWLRNKVGEPPVLTSSVNLSMNKDLMVNYLQNRGFFNAKAIARFKTDSGKKRTTAIFEIKTGVQYITNKAFLIKDSSVINRYVDSSFTNTLLKEGSPYNLELIKAERARIDKDLKEQGYFYFKPDYLLIIVDSTIGNKKVDMYVRLKHKDIPPEAYVRYTINDIYIYANYKLNGTDVDTNKTDAVIFDGYHIIDADKKYKPFIFSDALLFEKGEHYIRSDQNGTISRLINLGTFKFVKNRFETVNDSMLNVFFYITSYPKKSIRFQIGALTQNDNKAGSQASISWKNRNTFKGAEELSIKVHGGFDLQYSGITKQPNIYTLGAETNLSTPRFVVPFIKIQTSESSLPHSIIKLKYNYESQSTLLRINSYTAAYGYDWKQGLHIGHQLYPFNFTYVRTDTLGDISKLNAYYSSLIFNGIIIGPTYEFTYNSQAGPVRTHSFYFDGLIDFSGNILGVAEHADHNKNPQTLFGSPYAQYMKFQPDFRYYLKVSNSVNIASRLLAGVGVPYGNSTQLPNIKQFWAGGNSDLRGFSSRLVGPGTFSAYNDAKAGNYFETLGDIKLEANVEMRHHIYKFLNGAIFCDAGNIWLYNNNPVFKGGQFSSNFYKEIAVDVGLGLRFDFKILILRFDLGIPVRKPWLAENERWVFNDIKFADPGWKKNNMVLNIGIGYPF
jgi:outer membrane protein insertion porin family